MTTTKDQIWTDGLEVTTIHRPYGQSTDAIPGDLVVVATIGLPGSGKSTFAERWLTEGAWRTRSNRDFYRQMMFGQKAPGRLLDDQENLITMIQQGQIRLSLGLGYSVIVDDTNLSDERRNGLLALAEDNDAYFVEVDFRKIPIDTCISRDAMRATSGGRLVGRTVIRAMAAQHGISEPNKEN